MAQHPVFCYITTKESWFNKNSTKNPSKSFWQTMRHQHVLRSARLTSGLEQLINQKNNNNLDFFKSATYMPTLVVPHCSKSPFFGRKIKFLGKTCIWFFESSLKKDFELKMNQEIFQISICLSRIGQNWLLAMLCNFNLGTKIQWFDTF